MGLFPTGNPLFVGAHIDDIEYGSGGLLLRLKSMDARPRVLIFSRCEDQPRNIGITNEFYEAMDFLGIEDHQLLDMPNTRLPECAAEIRSVLEASKESQPQLIVTCALNTTHQDHFVVAKECERVFRNVTMISFEDIKAAPYFVPNLYLSLTEDEFTKKMQLLSMYKTQHRRYYMKPDVLEAHSRFRGAQIGVRYAEAFEIVRMRI